MTMRVASPKTLTPASEKPEETLFSAGDEVCISDSYLTQFVVKNFSVLLEPVLKPSTLPTFKNAADENEFAAIQDKWYAAKENLKRAIESKDWDNASVSLGELLTSGYEWWEIPAFNKQIEEEKSNTRDWIKTHREVEASKLDWDSQASMATAMIVQQENEDVNDRVARIEARKTERLEKMLAEVHQVVASASGRPENSPLTPSTYFAIAKQLESMGEWQAAYNEYMLASKNADTLAEAKNYYVAAINVLPPEQLAKKVDELSAEFNVRLPALERIFEKTERALTKLEESIHALSGFIAATENASSHDELEKIILKFSSDHPEAIKLARWVLTVQKHATGSVTPDVAYLQSEEALLESGKLLQMMEKIPSPEELMMMQEFGMSPAKIMGLDPLDSDFATAGYEPTGIFTPAEERETGSKEMILEAKIHTWEVYYKAAVAGQNIETIKAAENDLMTMIDQRIAETKGKIPFNEATLYAQFTLGILETATKRMGHIEAALKKDGPMQALAEYSKYSVMATKAQCTLIHHLETTSPEQKKTAKELTASLDIHIKLNGNLARHGYSIALDKELPLLMKRYSDTDAAARAFAKLYAQFPHRFNNGCTVTGLNFSEDEKGRAAASNEEAFLLTIDDSLGHKASVLGIGAAGGGTGCVIGMGLGAIAGGYFAGLGAAAGAKIGCSIGGTIGGMLGGATYDYETTNDNAEENTFLINDASKTGVSLVSEEEASAYKFNAYANAVSNGLFFGTTGALFGTGLVKLGAHVIGAKLTGSVLVAEAASGVALGEVATIAAEVATASTESEIARLSFTASRSYFAKAFWKDLWGKNIKHSFWRPAADFSKNEARFAANVALKIGKGAGDAVKFLQHGKELLQWVPGSIYAAYDLVKNNGKLSLEGAIAMAMPFNQLARIALQLKSSGSAMFLAFTIGQEYMTQVQGGNDFTKPNGWNVLFELACGAPLRAYSNWIIKGDSRSVHSLIDPVVYSTKKYVLEHFGKYGGAFFRSIENPRNAGILWELKKFGGREVKMHTLLGRTMEFIYTTPVIAGSILLQSKAQDAYFPYAVYEKGFAYLFGAYISFPYLKAPFDMDSFWAELGSRSAYLPFKFLWGEMANKYLPRVNGFRTGISNFGSKPEYYTEYLREKISDSFGSLELLSGLERMAEEPYNNETFYRPNPIAIKGFKKHLGLILLGEANGKHDYSQLYQKAYKVYAENEEHTIGQVAYNFINYYDWFLHNVPLNDNDSDTFDMAFIVATADVLRDFVMIRAESNEQEKLRDLAEEILNAHESAIKNAEGRLRLKHPELINAN